MAKNIVLIVIMSAVLFSCTTTPEKILEKYNDYEEVPVNKNGIGLSIDFAANSANSIKDFLGNNVVLSFSNSLVNSDNEYKDAIAKRIFVASANNPNELFSITTYTGSIIETKTIYGDVSSSNSKKTEYIHFSLDTVNYRFVLVGFKGIYITESEELETVPFFVILDKKEKKVLTTVPLQWKMPFSDEEMEPRFFEHHAILKVATDFGEEKKYTIRISEIGNDENFNGYTFVDFISDEIKYEDISEGNFYYTDLKKYYSLYSPICTEIVVGKTLFDFIRYAVLEDKSGNTVGVRHYYKTESLPDTINVYSAKIGGISMSGYYNLYTKVVFCDTVKFNGKTREVIKKVKII